MDKLSQKRQILRWLEQGHRINPQIALKRFHCMRLAARIADIRHDGYLIDREIVREDDGTHYAEYWMVRDE